MPRRKTKAPSTDTAPALDAPAAPVAAPAAEADAQAVQPPAPPTEPDSAPLLPDVVVGYGDLAEDETAWFSLRDELAAYYGATGPVETALVDRITDLRWRLDRLARAERGMVAAATIGVNWRRSMDRVVEAHEEFAWARMQTQSVLSAKRSTTLQLARHDLAEVIEQWDMGAEPDTAQIFKPIQVLFGCDKDGMPHGQGKGLYYAWELVGMARKDTADRAKGKPSHYDDDEEERPANYLEQVEQSMRRQLGETLEMVDGLIESLAQDERHRDVATVEAYGIPESGNLRALGQYEQHLTAALERATAELQRTIARRRLAGLARRARLV